MSGDPCRPQAQGDRCDRRSVHLFILRGIPAHIRSDNGPEFVAKAVQEWIAAVGTKTAYIERGSPWENGYIESFNARLRDELLNGEIFYTLREAQIVIESWRRHYNTIRPHASIGYKPPAPEVFVPAFAAWPAALRQPARAFIHLPRRNPRLCCPSGNAPTTKLLKLEKRPANAARPVSFSLLFDVSLEHSEKPQAQTLARLRPEANL